MMERLRTDHDCNPHDWRKRNGGGQCSECHHHLPLYLLVSTSIFIGDTRLMVPLSTAEVATERRVLDAQEIAFDGTGLLY